MAKKEIYNIELPSERGSRTSSSGGMRTRANGGTTRNSGASRSGVGTRTGASSTRGGSSRGGYASGARNGASKKKISTGTSNRSGYGSGSRTGSASSRNGASTRTGSASSRRGYDSRRDSSEYRSSTRGASRTTSSRNRHIDEYEGAENYERPRRSSRQIAKARKKRKRRKILFIIEAIALILLLLFLFAWLKLGLINWDDLKNLRTNKLDDETAALLDGYTTVAFFGVDNRSAGHYEGGNSDSIMICTINNDTKEVRVASVYRDTVLDVDGKGTYKKCNYAYNHGGPEEAINMLNLNMDLDIQKYVAVDFFALAEVIDAFGGIDLDITEDEAYHMNSGGDMCYIWETATSAGVEVPPDVTPGTGVHVNGVQAVADARIRKTSGGDFARAQRQRIVLEKVVEKAQHANIFTLNKVADAAFDDVGTNFTLNQILSLAKYVKDYQLVDTAGFPFYKNSEHRLEGTSVVCPCTLESNVRQLHAFLYNNPEVKLSDVVVSTSKDIENLMGLGEEDALDYGY